MTIFKAGTTAYANAGTNVQTGSTNPAPPSGFASYDYVEGAFLGFRQWTLPGDGPWQFAELVYIDSVTGPPTGTAGPDLDFIALRNTNDTVNGLIVREQGRGLMRAVETGGTFPWTGTVQWPITGWYWVKGYGNASTNTGRIVLTDLNHTVLTGFDSGVITIAQGTVNPTSVRFGKLSATSTWTGRMAWCGMELRTGTDAAQALLVPAVSANQAPVANAGSAQVVQVGVQVSLAGTATDADGTIASSQWTCVTSPGTAPTITSPTSLTAAKVTPVDPGFYTFQLMVTDNSGSISAPSTVNVYVYPVSGTPAKVLSVTQGSWTLGGSPSSNIVALNDGVATTYLESPSGAVGQPVTVIFSPTGPGQITLPISGYSSGGPVSRKIDVFKGDGVTKIFDDPAFTLPTTDAVHTITLDTAALAAVPNVTDRVALVAIIKDTAI